ncbi:MAG: hypothetical protein D6834_03765 [Aquificota bacterium]|nr:MAG: hypothetical protein D6834_03765 [Aquificota bacterium]
MIQRFTERIDHRLKRFFSYSSAGIRKIFHIKIGYSYSVLVHFFKNPFPKTFSQPDGNVDGFPGGGLEANNINVVEDVVNNGSLIQFQNVFSFPSSNILPGGGLGTTDSNIYEEVSVNTNVTNIFLNINESLIN